MEETDVSGVAKRVTGHLTVHLLRYLLGVTTAATDAVK
jgi:hypothetical protein